MANQSENTLQSSAAAATELVLDPPASRPSEAQPAGSPLIAAVVAATSGKSPPNSRALEDFLREPESARAIGQWLAGRFSGTKDDLVRRLNRDVSEIDRLLNDQINAILHAPRFQKLEASWRGLHYLVNRVEAEGDPSVKIKVLSVGWRELERDFDRAVEFDQSQTFKAIYESEFGTPGGEPYGTIIADYEIQPRPTPDHPHDDLRIVESLASVGAAAFCPIVLNAGPAMFELENFDRLEQHLDHEKTHARVDFLKWRALREKEDSRFIGLTMPHVLMRTPYEDDTSRTDGFCFQEDVSGPDRSKYLWGGAAYAFGGVLVRSFAQAGWLADIRGVQRGLDVGGLVSDLPKHNFGTDRAGLVTKASTDVIITDDLERELSELGFMPLSHCKDTDYSAFYSNQSAQKPAKYDKPIATVNAQISSMLQYMLCVSRFAHYVKVLARDKLGTFTDYSDFEKFLHDWIVQYVTADAEASPETKSRFPLREAEVRVVPNPGKPGSYSCQMRLMPHYELDELQASVRVVAELTPGRGTTN